MTPSADLVARLLRELVTLVRGECPALLNEDSGGDARLSLAIDDALAALPPPADPLYEYCPSCRRLGPLFGLTAIRSEETGGRHCIACYGKTESRLLPLWTAPPPPAAPPALVALVREWQRAQRGCDIESTASAVADAAKADDALLAYPLPAAPPVTDTPQGCPTCGGPRPCDRCTTRNVVDVDALKARLESERLRAAAEIVKLIADDSWAIAFQSLGQYRSALLKAWRDSAPAAPPQEDQ